jgi:hypothetical protein
MLRLRSKAEQDDLINLGYQITFEKISTWEVKK